MNYHNITKQDMLNGEGLRVVLWVAGCNHRCPGCHNPITWDENGGLPFDSQAEEELFEALNQPFIDGITFSGGDPLFPSNREEVTRLIKKCRAEYPEKTIWLYTGSDWEDIWQMPLMKYVDVCVDGEFKIDLKDTKLLWKGSSNQRVIDVQATLQKEDKTVPVLHCGDYK